MFIFKKKYLLIQPTSIISGTNIPFTAFQCTPGQYRDKKCEIIVHLLDFMANPA